MKKTLVCFLSLLISAQLSCTDISWSFPPTTISNASFNSSDPQIATDSNGDVVAVWVENSIIKSSSKPLNMNWTSAVTLSNTNASSPRLVSDLSGNAIAIWLEGTTVKAASKPFGGSWSASTALSTSGAANPALAIDSAGDVIAAWAKSGGIQTATKLFGANWQNAVSITSTSATLPSIAVSGTGTNKRAVVVWNGLSGTTNVIYASSKLLTGNWTTQQVISNTNFQAGFPNVAMDANANATAVWYQYNVTNSIYSQVNVNVASRDVISGNWSTPLSLSADGIRNPATLVARVAYDANGNAVAIWNTSFDDMTYNIEASLLPIKGDWTAPTDLVSSNLFSSQLDLSTVSFGDALTTYMFYNGVSLIIQSSESNLTGFLENVWSIPVNVSNTTQNANPRVTATLNGNSIKSAAVWISTSGSNTVIKAVTGSKNLVLPPSMVNVVQNSTNFGVFTEYTNNVSWTASTDPNAVGYLIYRNGTLIGQVGASTTQFNDQNRIQNGSVTYGVATLSNDTSQSVIVSDSFP